MTVQVGQFKPRASLLASLCLCLQLVIEKTTAQTGSRTAISIRMKCDDHEIVPDLLDEAPVNEIEVVYSGMIACPPDGRNVNFGDYISPGETKTEPSVEWPAEPYRKHYTLVMVDPDAPSRSAPTMREWEHWLVVNIPGHDVMSGQILTDYVGASPPNGTGLHRYAFIVYEQPKKNMSFDEPHIGRKADQMRSMFSTRRFADEYKLGKPWAVNWFTSEYEAPPKQEDD